MASLAEQMKRNKATFKQGGASSLQETSQEELQKLASNAGMPTTPSSPLSSAGIGANPDQAKMIGTPAQGNSAIRLANQPQSDLQTAQRQEQARKTSTGAEQEAIERSTKLEGLGSLGDRVQQITTGMLNQASTGANVIENKRIADSSIVGQYLAAGADQAETENLLNKLGDGTVTDQEMVQLGANLGYTNVTDLQALKNAINNQFMKESEQVGQFTAQKIGDTLQIAQLSGPQLEQLGFSSIEDMAAALQVDPAALQGMTLRQLQDQFGKESMEDFAKARSAQAVLADPSSSRALREQALRELKELGATGVRAAESDVKKIEEQVQNADTVDFGGKSYTVDQLLKDDTITGLAKEFFANPEAAKLLKEKEPQFAQWLEDNQKVIAAASANVDARQETFAKIQLDNMAMAETDVGKLSDSAMKAIIPDYGTIKAQRDTAPPFLAMIKNNEIPQDTAVDMVNTMNDLSNIDPEYVSSMAGLDVQEINALGLNSKEGINDYRNYVKKTIELQNAPEEELIARVTDGQYTEEDIRDIALDNDAMESFGIGRAQDPNFALLNAWSGDNQKAFADTFVNLNGGTGPDGQPMTVREMLEKGMTATSYQSGADRMRAVQAATASKAQSNDLFRKYGSFWKGDRQFTPVEAAAIGNEMLKHNDITKVDELTNLRNTAQMSDASKGELDYYLNKTGENEAQRLLDSSGYGTRAAWDTDVQQLLTGGFDGAKIGKMQNSLSDLTNQMVSNPTYKNPVFQTHLKYRVDQMARAITSNLSKMPVEEQPDKALEQVKNLAKVLKYGANSVVGGATIAPDAYRELSRFTTEKFGFPLPLEGGVEAINQSVDKVSQAIAAVGRDFFRDPRRAATAAISGGLSEVRNVVSNITGGGGGGGISVGGIKI